jgi:hypothetical protein
MTVQAYLHTRLEMVSEISSKGGSMWSRTEKGFETRRGREGGAVVEVERESGIPSLWLRCAFYFPSSFVLLRLVVCRCHKELSSEPAFMIWRFFIPLFHAAEVLSGHRLLFSFHSLVAELVHVKPLRKVPCLKYY